MMKRSCSDLAGTCRTSSGRFTCHCAIHRSAAGFRLGFAASDDTLISDFVALAPEALPVYVRTDAPKRAHSSLVRMDSAQEARNPDP